MKDHYLEDLLNSIPVVKNFDLDIKEVTDTTVKVKSPLSTHINYEGTAFGGSLNTNCVLASYLLVHHIMKMNDVNIDSLVIQNSSINYLKPVQSDFETISCVEIEERSRFLKMLKSKSIARIKVEAKVRTNDSSEDLVVFTARFVANATLST